MNLKFSPQLTQAGFFARLEYIIKLHPLLYLFVRNLLKYTSIFETDFNGIKLIKFENKTINLIDVGASDGIAVNFFLKKLDKNIIKAYCFEPNSKYFQILKSNKNIYKVFNYGLSNNEKVNDVYIPYYTFFKKKFSLPTYTTNKYHEAKKFIQNDFYFNKNIFISKIKIKLKKFPYKSNIIKKIDFIKIDVNGFELSVLKTLNQIIKKNKPALYLEITFQKKEIVKFLMQFKYEVYFYCNKDNKLKKGFQKTIVNYFCLQKKHLY